MSSRFSPGPAVGTFAPEIHTRIDELARTEYELLCWLPYQLLQFPAEFHSGLLDEFGRLNAERREVEATMLFFRLRQKLTPSTLSLASSDDELIAAAERCAGECAALAGTGRGPAITYLYLAAFARERGLRPPEVRERYTAAVAVAKLGDPLWWRHALRIYLARAVEQEARRLGLVSRFKGLYVSDRSYARWQQQNARNRLTLEKLVAVNELGEAFCLADLSKRSVANPRCRRAELMTRIAGFDAYALAHDHIGVMFTVTTPSRMHARLAASGAANPNYDGTDPAQAQDYLCCLWAAARAAFQRAKLRPYGFRIAEPQHDGTPHWHLLLFMPASELAQVRRILRHYALACDGDEPGAEEHRVHEVVIDRSRGSAAGYLAKYISKNVDGEHLERTEPGAPQRAQRVRAWASVWGIRQFQQIGNPMVTIWRELRRGCASGSDETLAHAAAAADRGDWQGFVEELGGPRIARRDAPLALYKRWETRLGRYGLQVGWVIAGVMSQHACVTTRLHTWTIRPESATGSQAAATRPGARVRDGPLEYCQ